MTEGCGDTDEADAYPAAFTAAFISHCRASRLPPRLFRDLRAALSRQPRYIRLRPPAAALSPSNLSSPELSSAALSSLAASLGLSPRAVSAVDWLPRCAALPRDTRVHTALSAHSELSELSELTELSQLTEFSDFSRAVVPMDAASVASAVALRPRRGEIVWDVCCAPGMKIGIVADAVGAGGVAVGTDIRVDRLFTARAVLRRQKVENVCLFAADGTRFAMGRAAEAVREEGKESRRGNGLTAREEQRLRKRAATTTTTTAITTRMEKDEMHLVFATKTARQSLARAAASANAGFDRVLVDAECSHDGSLSHLFFDDATRRPFRAADAADTARGMDNANRMQQLHLPRATDNNRVNDLSALQLQLLRAGFSQLRPGGTLVYSTCSFAYEQNEGVVRKFLRGAGGEAVAVHPFDFSRDAEGEVSPAVDLSETQAAALRARLDASGDPYGIVAAGDASEGSAEFTGVRFWPHAFDTSFQFVSKIWKKPMDD